MLLAVWLCGSSKLFNNRNHLQGKVLYEVFRLFWTWICFEETVTATIFPKYVI